MKKTIFFSLIGLVVLVILLGGIKGLQIKSMIAQGEQMAPPPTPVTTAAVNSARWSMALTAVGSLEAVQGVTVTAEISGKVTRIEFEAGRAVARGDLLVQQDVSTETAQMRSAQASMELARLNLKRARELLPENVITRANFDTVEAAFKQAAAQVDTIRATIAKKTIRAPFAGRLGLRQVNLGQNLSEGDPIVVLQSMDPIFVNFQLPQQELALIKRGLTVNVTTDALPGETVAGRITAINPVVDRATRNIRVQATMVNPEEHLRPGMFVRVAVALPTIREVLAIPATAVLYAPYSDSVFVVEPAPADGKAGKGSVVRQQFIRLGEKRGDFIAIASGLKAGEVVVSTGAFKLRNGQPVVVDNSLAPDFTLTPKPEEG
ncbi:Efflux pump, RND family, membrane fusion protein [Desulfosarcina cetonica]|nr:Efflux pump, RND family, membrane fusion protein [Desulfosarcina cetonica]